MLDLSQFDALTFDCYGTLIDWESGIIDAVQPVLRAHGVTVDDRELLGLYSTFEPEAEQADDHFKPYRRVLVEVMDRFAQHFKVSLRDEERGVLGDSVPRWKPFPDTNPALRILAQHYRLGILSNIDNDLIERTKAHLNAPFEVVVTAQQVGVYKPAPDHFLEGLRRFGLPPERVLHVAESRYHDISPAKVLGLRTVWVNRKAGQVGASRDTDTEPDLEVPDLAALSAMVG